jgi:Resolvase, N terminal domain
MSHVRANFRASTEDQDVQQARLPLAQFEATHGRLVTSWYAENESGAKLRRPELFRLLGDRHPGDVLLVDQVDRLSRLSVDDWEAPTYAIKAKGVRVVALDLPTSHGAIRAAPPHNPGQEADPTELILQAVNAMHAGHARRDGAQGLHRPSPPSG